MSSDSAICFFQSLSPILFRHGETTEWNASIGVTEKGVLPIESMLLARYQMFVSVYWHHTARALTAMLHYAVQQYIGLDPAAANFKLERLVDAFRTNDDMEALKWLREQVGASSAVLGAICDGLEGERNKIYWPAFQLRYDRKEGQSHRVAEWFTGWADALNKARDPVEFVRGGNALREAIGNGLSGELKSSVTFSQGEVLVDIPPPGKDQVENVWIQVGGQPTQMRPIQEVSPLAEAVSDAFRHWARTPRIFLAPSAWNRLFEAGIAEQNVEEKLWKVLLKLQRDLDPQGHFNFDEELGSE